MENETGFICDRCAHSRGAAWPSGHAATCHKGRCPYCKSERTLASVGDYNWPAGSNKPKESAGRD